MGFGVFNKCGEIGILDVGDVLAFWYTACLLAVDSGWILGATECLTSYLGPIYLPSCPSITWYDVYAINPLGLC